MIKLTGASVATAGALALAVGYAIDEVNPRRRHTSVRHLASSLLLFAGGVSLASGLGVLLDHADPTKGPPR